MRSKPSANKIAFETNNKFKLKLYPEQNSINKRQRIPKGQSKMDNSEKLPTYSTEDEEKTQIKGI